MNSPFSLFPKFTLHHMWMARYVCQLPFSPQITLIFHFLLFFEAFSLFSSKPSVCFQLSNSTELFKMTASYRNFLKTSFKVLKFFGIWIDGELPNTRNVVSILYHLLLYRPSLSYKTLVHCEIRKYSNWTNYWCCCFNAFNCRCFLSNNLFYSQEKKICKAFNIAGRSCWVSVVD